MRDMPDMADTARDAYLLVDDAAKDVGAPLLHGHRPL